MKPSLVTASPALLHLSAPSARLSFFCEGASRAANTDVLLRPTLTSRAFVTGLLLAASQSASAACEVEDLRAASSEFTIVLTGPEVELEEVAPGIFIEVPGSDRTLEVSDDSGLGIDWTLTVRDDAIDISSSIVVNGIDVRTTETLLRHSGCDDIVLRMGSGDDVVDASSATLPLTVSGGDGADTLIGGTAPDTLDGGAGEDTLIGGPGADTLIGGSEADELQGGTGDDQLFGGRGADWIVGGDGDDYVEGQAGPDRIYGDFDAADAALGTGDDELHGGSGPDEIHGGPGDDHIEGGGANDLLFGDFAVEDAALGYGDDAIYGDAGADAIYGGPGADHLEGNGGDDTIDCGPLDPEPGLEFIETVAGGPGSDTFHGAGEVYLTGGDWSWGPFDHEAFARSAPNLGNAQCDVELDVDHTVHLVTEYTTMVTQQQMHLWTLCVSTAGGPGGEDCSQYEYVPIPDPVCL